MAQVDAEFLKLFDNVVDLNLGDKECPEAKPLSERDIVAAEYKEKSPFAVIYRDHHGEYRDFVLYKQYSELDAFLAAHARSKAKWTPTFLIKTLTNMGLVMCHLQHHQISPDCVIVDVLVRTHGDLSNVYLSTTIYAVFSSDKTIDKDDIMDAKLQLVNHVFDIRSVSVQEQIWGQNYAAKKKTQ